MRMMMATFVCFFSLGRSVGRCLVRVSATNYLVLTRSGPKQAEFLASRFGVKTYVFLGDLPVWYSLFSTVLIRSTFARRQQ